MCVSVLAYAHMCVVCLRDMATHLLKMQSQIVVSCLLWMLGAKLKLYVGTCS